MGQYNNIVIFVLRIRDDIFRPRNVAVIHPEAEGQQHDLAAVNRLGQTHVVRFLIVIHQLPASQVFFKPAERKILTVQPVAVGDQVVLVHVFVVMISPGDCIRNLCLFQNLVGPVNRLPVVFPGQVCRVRHVTRIDVHNALIFILCFRDPFFLLKQDILIELRGVLHI